MRAEDPSCISLAMPLWNSLFGPKWDPGKLKVQLQLSLSRMKQVRAKNQANETKLKREIALMLKDNQTDKAAVKAEQLLQLQHRDFAVDLLNTIVETLKTRTAYIDSKPECPLDVIGHVASVLYCAPRLEEIPELAESEKIFRARYGADWQQLEHVHPRLVDALDLIPPSPSTVMSILARVAAEHRVDWAPPVIADDPFSIGAEAAQAMNRTPALDTVLSADQSGLHVGCAQGRQGSDRAPALPPATEVAPAYATPAAAPEVLTGTVVEPMASPQSVSGPPSSAGGVEFPDLQDVPQGDLKVSAPPAPAELTLEERLAALKM